jgi:hypothetical protein
LKTRGSEDSSGGEAIFRCLASGLWLVPSSTTRLVFLRGMGLRIRGICFLSLIGRPKLSSTCPVLFSGELPSNCIGDLVFGQLSHCWSPWKVWYCFLASRYAMRAITGQSKEPRCLMPESVLMAEAQQLSRL